MRPYQQGQDLQNIIQTAIPDFVEAEYPLFVEFLSAFCRFMEQERVLAPQTIYPEYGMSTNATINVTSTLGGTVYETRKLLEYRDISSTLDEFHKHFLGMFAKQFPQYSYVPADLLIKSLRQFYQAKGTEDSIKWFFRSFFNEAAHVYYPHVDILKSSDATWVAPLTIKVSEPIEHPTTGVTPENDAVATYYVGQRVQTATGSAQVERVGTTIVGHGFNQRVVVNELTLKYGTVLGTFEAGQTLYNIDSTDVVYTVILPVISGVVVNSGGSNYAVGDLVSFSEGPAGGQGYGALGSVAAVASTALNGVLVLEGGSGYIVGLPVAFTSSTGNGASAVISEIVFGEVLLETGDGYVVLESSTLSNPDIIQLEDRNTLVFELTIDRFVNASATVTLDSTDYGVDANVAQMEGLTLDSSLELAMAASDEQPFMHPWVFTNSDRTTAALANVATMLTLTSNTFFTNGARVFLLNSPTDITTNVGNANTVANVIVSDILVGGAGKDLLYLKETVNGAAFLVGSVVKQTGNGTAQNGDVWTTSGSANVVGVGTAFTSLLRPNTHIRFDDGTHATVRTVVNNTLIHMFAPVGVTLAANAWSIVPTGTIIDVTQQAQRYYGKIKAVTMTASGDRYETPPLVTAESVSAEAQELFYLDVAPAASVWTERPSAPNTVSWGAVTYGEGLFVATAAIDGAGFGIMTSPDGATWTPRASAEDAVVWGSVTYGNGTFVAVGASGAGNRVMTSPTGVTWTDSPSANDSLLWNGVAYGNGIFVAVSSVGGTDGCMTSPDGTTWTLRTMPAGEWSAVTYGGGVFVAVSSEEGELNCVCASFDGITWTLQEGVRTLGLTDVTFGNGVFVAVAGARQVAGTTVITSTNGITWTPQITPDDDIAARYYSVTYGNGLFVTVAYDSDDSESRVMTSPNGVDWTKQSTPTTDGYDAASWRDVAHGNGTFVVVGQSPLTNISAGAMSSPDSQIDSILATDGQVDVFQNATLEAQQSAGQITKVKILSSGVGYTDANNITIDAIHGDGREGNQAVLSPVIGTQTQYPGIFTTTRGFLSSNKYLQDSEYYNNYTYEVRVAESFNRYRAILMKLLHPAGFKALGAYYEVMVAPTVEVTADMEFSVE